MKKHKAFFSISLVILMILLLGMNGLVFAEENMDVVISDNAGSEENLISPIVPDPTDIQGDK